jgi:Pregnancy-associated plasma protein-A/Secretion system C-terminal sorting domain
MKKIILSLTAMLCLYGMANAQENACGTMKIYKTELATHPEWLNAEDAYNHQASLKPDAFLSNPRMHPELMNEKDGSSVTPNVIIPVVFHVVYQVSHPEENISDDQIISQIEALNRDYGFHNTDTLLSSHPFYPRAAKTGIQFCLAKTDPWGLPTSGITRDTTSTESWDLNSNANWVKSKIRGGADQWDPGKYLNIWVCNLALPVLGYATFPWNLPDNPKMDGIVIGFNHIGTRGTLMAGTALGRTATHEAGHWLGLIHIWGDDTCGTDRVTDTPPAVYLDFGCPSYPHRPHNQCGSDSLGELYMNYMNYVDDNCMNMFTWGQVQRMQTTFETQRYEMRRTNCNGPSGITQVGGKNIHFLISPNPAKQEVEITMPVFIDGAYTVKVFDLSGRLCAAYEIGNSEKNLIDIGSLSNGMYQVIVSNMENQGVGKLLIQH